MVEVNVNVFPARVVPAGQPQATVAGLLGWCEANQRELRKILLHRGAIMFRGFDVRSSDEFGAVARATAGIELLNYVGGVSRRKRVADEVYTSTDYPADMDLPCHNELSHTREWVRLIVFWCEQPSVTRGETPLVDGRRVVRRLSPATVDRFRDQKVTYTRFLHSGDDSGVLERNIRILHESGYPFSLSWQHTYSTSDRSVVARMAESLGATIAWSSQGDLSWSETLPVIRRHYETEEECWFSHLLTFHPSRMDASTRTRLPEREYPRNIAFGDGSPISDAIVDEVRAAVAAEEAVVPWEAGDVVLIDNVLVAHGRRTFEGPRRVLVAMAGTPLEAGGRR